MILPLPDLRQRDTYSCGRIVLEALHVFWGRPLKPVLAALSNPVQGLGPDTMDAALRASGFNVLSGSMTVEMLKSLTRDGYPVGCLVQYESVGHWVLVGGVKRNRIHFMCPVRGLLSRPVSEWGLQWIDCHLLGGEYSRWGVVAHP